MVSNECSSAADAAPSHADDFIDLDRVQHMGELLRSVQYRESVDVAKALFEINRATVDMVPGATCAGITLVRRRGEIETLGATSSYPRLLDDIQRNVDEGPCMSGAWEHHTIRVDDLWEERRWLLFRVAAIQAAPIRSILSFKLFDDTRDMAALNIYAEGAHAFDDDAVELGLTLAAHTSLAWSALRREEQFRSALASRDVIGQAKGIIMERFDIDAVAAFELMKKLSQESNVKLNDVAERVARRKS